MRVEQATVVGDGANILRLHFASTVDRGTPVETEESCSSYGTLDIVSKANPEKAPGATIRKAPRMHRCGIDAVRDRHRISTSGIIVLDICR